MDEQDRKPLAKALTVLGETFNETVSPTRHAAYFDALSDHGIADVILAAKTAVRTMRFFPKPVELIELIVGTDDDAWGEVEDQVRHIGYVGTPHFSNPATLAAIEIIAGSWIRFCHILPLAGPEKLGWRKQFNSAFGTSTMRHQQQEISSSTHPELMSAVRQLADEKGFPE